MFSSYMHCMFLLPINQLELAKKSPYTNLTFCNVSCLVLVPNIRYQPNIRQHFLAEYSFSAETRKSVFGRSLVAIAIKSAAKEITLLVTCWHVKCGLNIWFTLVISPPELSVHVCRQESALNTPGTMFTRLSSCIWHVTSSATQRPLGSWGAIHQLLKHYS
jgi:hypothetical protein